MKLRAIFALLICVLFLTGCRTTQIQYNPNPTVDLQEARKIILQVILEQPRDSAPSSVDINDEYIQITLNATRKSMIAGGVTTVPITETLFFNNIKSTELYSGRRYYVVLVKENSGNIKLRVLTGEEKKGKLFIDALKALEKSYFLKNK